MTRQTHDRLPDAWTLSTVGELCSASNGLAFKPEDWRSHGTPIIRIQNLNGSMDFNYCSSALPSQYLIPSGTLLFSWSGNRGTSFGPYIWEGPTGALNQHIFRITPKLAVDQSWLYSALDEVRRQVERTAHGGSGLVHVRRGDFLTFLIPTPPLPEQRLIAEILDTLDEAIRKTEQLIAKLKLVKQGLLHDLLTRGIDENGELRDPERHPEQFKDSPLGRIPREWETAKLTETTAAPICYGIVQAGAYYPGGPYVLTIGDLSGDFRTGLHRTMPQIEQRYSRSRVAPGDVLLSIKGTIGRTGIVPLGFEGNISRDLARLRPARNILSGFVHQYLGSPTGQRRLERAVVGTTRAEISIHALKHFAIPIANLKEQEEIVRRLGCNEAAAGSEEASLNKLRLVRTGLMDDLLTGRVRVTPLLEAEP